jgi:glycerol-3-phosphate dehydrogenase
MQDHLYVYGSDIENVQQLMNENPELKERISPKYAFTKAEVVWAARKEFARTVDDVLARRCRLLFLDAHEAIKAAPVVAQIIAKELKRDDVWMQQQVSEFTTIAKGYVLN